MQKLIPLQDLSRKPRMTQVQIRLPNNIRERAKQIAKDQSSNNQKFTESDVYRTAILSFFSGISTECREQ